MNPRTLPPTDPPPPAPRVVLGLGSNLGSRIALLHAAMDLLDATDGLRVTARSSVWKTAPVGPPQPEYRNAAVCVASTLDLSQMLQATRAVEAKLGRVRETHWGPRTLDVDILWAATEHSADTLGDDLVVPHPRLRERAFALGPLCEVFPDAVDPATGERYEDVLASLIDPVPVRADFPTATVTDTPIPRSWNVLARAADRADLLAVCADALGQMLSPGESVRARDILAVHCPLTAADENQRLFAWLAAVLTSLSTTGFALRRAVVLCDSPDEIDGLLVGEAHGATEVHGRKRIGLVAASVAHVTDMAWTARGVFST